MLDLFITLEEFAFGRVKGVEPKKELKDTSLIFNDENDGNIKI